MAAEAWGNAGGVTAPGEGRPPAGELSPAERGMYALLFREGYRFDFFHAVQLLERFYPDAPAPGETTDVREERIRLTPSTSLVFPATDLKYVRLERRPAEHVHVAATFMGLYGVDSPLPEFVREKIALESEESYPLRDFLDIFNHRFYSFFYRAWKKYRPEIFSERSSRRNEMGQGRFFALAGLGTPRALEHAPISPSALAAFAGRLACRARNAEGLTQLVEQIVGLPATILQNVPQWVTIQQRPALGPRGGLRLGDSAVVGARIYDVAGKFRVRLGPMDLQRYLSLLPGGPDAKVLRWLTGLYVPDHLAYDAELQLKTSEIPPLKLGAPVCKLGLTTCLGRPAAEIMSRVVSYKEDPKPTAGGRNDERGKGGEGERMRGREGEREKESVGERADVPIPSFSHSPARPFLS